jgi:penicillin amidase
VTSARYQGAPIAELQAELTAWGAASDYDTPAGLNLDDGKPSADAAEAQASKATLLFNAWVVRAMELTYDDELKVIGLYDTGIEMRRSMTYLLTAPPASLATYDAATKDSALFDDMTTPNVVESRDDRMVTALLDAIDFLAGKLGANRDAWRWGALHTLTLQPLVPLWSGMAIPPSNDPVFPGGFPRHGDGYDVDVGAYDDHPASFSALSFVYGEGPVQRFVVDMDPAGPVARNAIPGGEVWDPANAHFRDDMELWRKNQNRPVPFTRADVIANAESHVVYAPTTP